MPKIKNNAQTREEQKLRQKLQKLFKKENNAQAISDVKMPINENKKDLFKNNKQKSELVNISKIKHQKIPKSQTVSGNKRMTKKIKGLSEKKFKPELKELVLHSSVDRSNPSEDDDFEEQLEFSSYLEEREEESGSFLDLEEDTENSVDSEDNDEDDYSYTTDEFSGENNSWNEDDLIIHQGTAVKRALEPNDGEVEFDTDPDNIQIVELVFKEEKRVDVLLQCPQLVPIENNLKTNINKNCKDALNSNSSSNEYSEITDSDCSCDSEHIIEKYENLDNFKDITHKMQADIIYGIGKSQFNILNDDKKEHASMNLQEDLTPACKMAQLLNFSDRSNAYIIASSNMLEEAETLIEEQVETQHLKQTKVSRMFKSNNEQYVLVLLKAPIFFYGTVRFKLIAGKIDVYGYQPPLNKEFELFSTRGCSCVSLTPIKTINNDSFTIEIALRSLEAHYDEAILSFIQGNYLQENDALVLLRRNTERAHTISHFKRHMNENIFPNVHSGAKKNSFQFFQQLDCFYNEQSTHALHVPLEWHNIPLKDQRADNRMRLMIAGGKSVGKSTLLRYMLNRLLNEQANYENGVLLIDLDVGQGEVGLSQTISCTLLKKPLLGPGFFYKLNPDCSYLVGQVNVTLCAQRYLNAVKLLTDHCHAHREYAKVPWLINTMGYNQGIGLELIAAICEHLHPTDVVQIKSNLSNNNFPCWLEVNSLRNLSREILDVSISTLNLDAELPKYDIPAYRLHTLRTAITQESSYQREWRMSAKDFRYASMLAQISDILSDEIYLIDRIPYCAELSDIKVLSLIEPYKPLKELHQALTANVVYLCQHIPKKDDKTPMKCLGIGIVRSLDLEHIYIIPAAVIDNMNQVNCLVLSEQPLPTTNLKVQGARVKNTILPFVYATEKHASTSVKQIYHRPSHFLSGKHKVFNN